jgi:hypothetical protein
MEVEPWHFDGEAVATLSFHGVLALGGLLEQFVC